MAWAFVCAARVGTPGQSKAKARKALTRSVSHDRRPVRKCAKTSFNMAFVEFEPEATAIVQIILTEASFGSDLEKMKDSYDRALLHGDYFFATFTFVAG